LHAQLGGDAACVVAGFQLNNDNYAHSVTILKEHFGQTYKQVDAHMQALIDLPVPNNSVSSLQEFHDATFVVYPLLGRMRTPMVVSLCQ